MHYREFRPHVRLREFVKCFWTLSHDYSQSVHSEEQLPPKGEIELIFHFGHRFALRVGENWLEQPTSFVIGQQERFFILRSGGTTGLVAARFHPWGAFPFFGLPISELNRQFVSLEAIFGAVAADLENALSDSGRDQGVRILENFLLLRLHNFENDLGPVAALARRIIAQQGQLRVGDLLRDQSLSQRQIERRFKEVVGIPPKRLARIIRFQCALESIYSNPHRELTETAYEYGYADQSHFISDFKLLFGKTPSRFEKRLRKDCLPGSMSNFYNRARITPSNVGALIKLEDKTMITEIGTAAVYVSDQKAAEEFWTKKIGFEVSAKKEMGGGMYWLEVKPAAAQSALVLYPRSAMEGWKEMKPSIVFQCDNFDETFEQLKANHVNVGHPMELPWGKFLKFKDPDGNDFGIRGNKY